MADIYATATGRGLANGATKADAYSFVTAIAVALTNDVINYSEIDGVLSDTTARTVAAGGGIWLVGWNVTFTDYAWNYAECPEIDLAGLASGNYLTWSINGGVTGIKFSDAPAYAVSYGGGDKGTVSYCWFENCVSVAGFDDYSQFKYNLVDGASNIFTGSAAVFGDVAFKVIGNKIINDASVNSVELWVGGSALFNVWNGANQCIRCISPNEIECSNNTFNDATTAISFEATTVAPLFNMNIFSNLTNAFLASGTISIGTDTLNNYYNVTNKTSGSITFRISRGNLSVAPDYVNEAGDDLTPQEPTLINIGPFGLEQALSIGAVMATAGGGGGGGAVGPWGMVR